VGPARLLAAPLPPAPRHVLVRALPDATGALSAEPWPVHLNFAFRDPLVPVAGWRPGSPPQPRVAVTPRGAPPPVDLPAGGRIVVVAGDAAGAQAARIARPVAGHCWPNRPPVHAAVRTSCPPTASCSPSSAVRWTA